jgi:hypothetical protein
LVGLVLFEDWSIANLLLCCRFQRFKFGVSFGLVAAFLATVGIAVVYIPSFVSTVIKFRSGLIPSLKAGPKFQQLRENPHRATTLLGSALWGSMYTACWSALFVGGAAFLAVWSVSEYLKNPAALFSKFADSNSSCSVPHSFFAGNANHRFVLCRVFLRRLYDLVDQICCCQDFPRSVHK